MRTIDIDRGPRTRQVVAQSWCRIPSSSVSSRVLLRLHIGQIDGLTVLEHASEYLLSRTFGKRVA